MTRRVGFQPTFNLTKALEPFCGSNITNVIKRLDPSALSSDQVV